MKRIVGWLKGLLKVYLDNNCALHAAGLTYFSMLALVPVLCVLLTVAQLCGADDLAKRQVNERVEAWIVQIEHGQDDKVASVIPGLSSQAETRRAQAEALAGQARMLRDGLFERIDSFNVGTLGWIGFALLVWTVISSISMVETSFNQIWGVPKPRSLWRRALLYLAIAVVLPIFAAAAMSVPVLNVVKDVIVATLGATWLTQWASDWLICFLDSWVLRFLITFVLTSVFFALVFDVVPHCRVRMRAALIGGSATAVLFGLWMKVCAVAQVGIANSSALYGSFAFLPIVLAWLYMSWQIILFGAVLTRMIDNPKNT